MFTVLIPTFNRPELLRVALESVSKQTVTNLIDCVIVSENGLNRGSEDVCNEFVNIKIKYFFHEEQLPISKHMKWVLSHVEEGYGAMLCDDDWWDIHHLELAHKTLITHQDCVAYFSNYTHEYDTHSLKGEGNSWARGMHYGKGNFSNYSPNVYDLENIMLLCLLFTPFHFSSIICKGEVLKKAVSIFDEVHPTYADRLLYPVIASYGDVVFNPLTTAIIFLHPGQDSHTYNASKWEIERQNGSLKLLEVSQRFGIDVKSHLNQVYEKLDAADQSFVRQEILVNFYQIENAKWFNGYDILLKKVEQNANAIREQKSFKRKLINFVKKVIRKII